MAVVLGKLRRRVFGISPTEVSFERRGFPGRGSAAQGPLERVCEFFIRGYHAALEEHEAGPLGERLERMDLDARGFAYEGAAMGLALFDRMTPWRRDRAASFLAGPGDRHAYMVHVGIGFALARLKKTRLEGLLRGRDSLLRWLILDGFGFHEGFFGWEATFVERLTPRGIRGYGRRGFDQGAGRALWFVSGGQAELIVKFIEGMEAERRGDLWSGIGLACAYAGGARREDIEMLKARAVGFGAELAQGACFAAKARLRAGNVIEHTRLACEVLCGLSAEAAAGLTDEALRDLPRDSAEVDFDVTMPAYETWRRRVQDRFGRRVEAAA